MNAIDFQELLRLEKQKWRRNRNANNKNTNGNTTRCSNTRTMSCCSTGAASSNSTTATATTNNDENDNVLLSFSSSLPMCSALQMQSQTQLDEGGILEKHRVLLMMHPPSVSASSSSSSSSSSSLPLVATLSDVYYMPEFLTPEFTKLLLDNLDESLLLACCCSLDCSSRSKNQSQQQQQQQQQQHPHNGTWTRLYYSQRNVAVFDLTQKPCCCDNIDNHNPRLHDVSLRLYVLLQTLAKALVEIKAFPETHPPNHVLINEYDASGGIMPHTDGPMYLDRTATFSIGGGDVLFCLDKNHHHHHKKKKEEEEKEGKMAMATTKEPPQCLLQPPEQTHVQAMQIKLLSSFDS